MSIHRCLDAIHISVEICVPSVSVVVYPYHNRAYLQYFDTMLLFK